MAPSATENIPIDCNILNQEHDRIVANRRAGSEYGQVLVQNVLKDRIASIDPATCEPGEEDAFFVADMGEIYRQHLRWKMNLKRVKPHYGKCKSAARKTSLTKYSCQM